MSVEKRQRQIGRRFGRIVIVLVVAELEHQLHGLGRVLVQAIHSPPLCMFEHRIGLARIAHQEQLYFAVDIGKVDNAEEGVLLVVNMSGYLLDAESCRSGFFQYAKYRLFVHYLIQ